MNLLPVSAPLRLTVSATKSYSSTAVILVASTVRSFTALPGSPKPKTLTLLTPLIAVTAAAVVASMLAKKSVVSRNVSSPSPPSTILLSSNWANANPTLSLPLPPVKLTLP